jgi:hypothetical protein
LTRVFLDFCSSSSFSFSQILPLTGDWKAKLRERYETCEIESVFGGELDVNARPVLPIHPYVPIPYAELGAKDVCGAAQAGVAHGAGAELEEGHEVVEEAAGDEVECARRMSSGEAQRPTLVTDNLVPRGAMPRVASVASPGQNGRSLSTASAGSAGSGSAVGKCGSVRSVKSVKSEAEDDEFHDAVSTPDEDTTHYHATHTPELDDGAQMRPRAAIFSGASPHHTDVDDSGHLGEPPEPAPLRKVSSTLELAQQKYDVLHAAHGGVWDAHSSTERAVLMKAAIHSMTEAGLDEEIAQKVFELDKVAVERVLLAAARGSQDGSPRGECLDEMLKVAEEYGLVIKKSGTNTPVTPSTPAMSVPLEADEARQKHAVHPTTPPTEPPAQDVWPVWPSQAVDERAAPDHTNILVTDDYLRAAMDGMTDRTWRLPQESSSNVPPQQEDARHTSGRPQALVGGTKPGVGTSPDTKINKQPNGVRRGGGEEQEEGTFDLVFSQLELLRLLQVVMR